MTLWDRLWDRATGTQSRTLAAVLTGILLGLKLTHGIDWSWWQVLGPLLGWAAMVVALMAVGMLTVAATYVKMWVRSR